MNNNKKMRRGKRRRNIPQVEETLKRTKIERRPRRRNIQKEDEETLQKKK